MLRFYLIWKQSKCENCFCYRIERDRWRYSQFIYYWADRNNVYQVSYYNIHILYENNVKSLWCDDVAKDTYT